MTDKDRGPSLASFDFPFGRVGSLEEQRVSLEMSSPLAWWEREEYKEICDVLYTEEVTPEQLRDLYSVTRFKDARFQSKLRGTFIIHPSATPELIRHISDESEVLSYYPQVLVSILSTVVTSQEHLIHLASLNIDSSFKYGIVNHPNSDFEVWEAVFFSGALGSRAEAELLARPAFEAGIRASFKDIEGDDLPFEWLLGLWKMDHMKEAEGSLRLAIPA